MMNPRIDDWQGRRVWLVGASTGIGAALVRVLSQHGARLALSSRRVAKLALLGIEDAVLVSCDVTETASLAAAHAQLMEAWGGIDLVVYLAGDYQPMQSTDFDLAKAEDIVAVNFGGAMKLAAAVLPRLSPGAGIAFVASVAGYRGLPQALAYGPGKAALIHFAECLHLELAPRGIGVWVINPGFVATRLTAKNDFAMPALLTPEQAAEEIVAGFRTGHFEIHFPKRFTRIIKLLAHLPYAWSFPLIRRFTGT
jgi:NAD(P)-dependent dehydrogenase (short-subunit alcohol dehydrogenase family)